MRLCLLVLVSQNATAQCNRKMQLCLRLRLTCYVFLELFLQIALYKKDDPPPFDSGDLTMKFALPLHWPVLAQQWTIWPHGEREPKSNSQIPDLIKDQNDEP